MSRILCLQLRGFLLTGGSIIFKYLFTLTFPMLQHIKLLTSTLKVELGAKRDPLEHWEQGRVSCPTPSL